MNCDIDWTDIYGNYVSASEMLALARKAGLELEEFLEQEYRELAKDDPHGGYDVDIDIKALAEQIYSEAIEDHVASYSEQEESNHGITEL